MTRCRGVLVPRHLHLGASQLLESFSVFHWATVLACEIVARAAAAVSDSTPASDGYSLLTCGAQSPC